MPSATHGLNTAEIARPRLARLMVWTWSIPIFRKRSPPAEPTATAARTMYLRKVIQESGEKNISVAGGAGCFSFHFILGVGAEFSGRALALGAKAHEFFGLGVKPLAVVLVLHRP